MQVRFQSLKQPLDGIEGIICREDDMKYQMLPEKTWVFNFFPRNPVAESFSAA